jgi:outer membrane protein assembly factor BamB
MKTISLLAGCVLPLAVLADDWSQFRGPNGGGVSAAKAAVRASPEVAWDSALPGRGLSCPIVVGNKVFVTAASGNEQTTLHVLCFSAEDGKKLWERTQRATGRTMSHKKTNVAAPTPCSDGERVFALYSSNDLVAYDLEGNLLWLRGLMLDYTNASNSLGMASSPVAVNGTLVVQSENDSESLALGIDVKTGVNRWKMERPKAANWTSATVFGETVALQSSKGLTGVDPLTGKVVWNYTDGASTIPSAAVTQKAIYVPSNGITALVPEADSTTQLWRAEKLKPGTASPLVLGNALYLVNGTGVLVKADLATGDELWKLRLKGPFSGSPVASGDHLFIASEQGDLQVIDPSGAAEGKIVHTVELKDTILSTPAVSGGALFVRSDTKLWKVK